MIRWLKFMHSWQVAENTMPATIQSDLREAAYLESSAPCDVFSAARTLAACECFLVNAAGVIETDGVGVDTQ